MARLIAVAMLAMTLKHCAVATPWTPRLRMLLQQAPKGSVKFMPKPGTPQAGDLLRNPATPDRLERLYSQYSDQAALTPEAAAAFYGALRNATDVRAALNALAKRNVSLWALSLPGLPLYLQDSGYTQLLRLFRRFVVTEDLPPLCARGATQQLGCIDDRVLQELVAATDVSSVLDWADNALPAPLRPASPPPRPRPTGGAGPGAAAARERALVDAVVPPDCTIPEDCGWKPGQALAPAPPFRGPKDGPYNPSGILVASGRGSIRTNSTALAPSGYVDLIQHYNPRSNRTRPVQFGRLVGFKPLTIPLVVHLTGFVDASGYYLPTYNWWADEAVANLVRGVNKLFDGSGITFKLQEARWSPVKYPYLNRRNLSAWQESPLTTIPALAAAHNVRGGPINVWVSGSARQYPCPPGPKCRSVAINGWTPTSPGDSPKWQTTAGVPPKQQVAAEFVWVSEDRVDPNQWNSDEHYQGGASVLAHELGHYLGLQHTFDPSSSCNSINDAVEDTAPNMEFGYPLLPYEIDLALLWCMQWRLGSNPPPKLLKLFNSCPDKSGMDNIFNLMSYIHDSCRMVFTENQVARMQWAIKSFRPNLLKQYANSRRR